MTLETLELFKAISRWLFLLSLGYYLLTNLQWYSYKLTRVLFKHHKWRWHIFYFFMPLLFFFVLGEYFYIYLYVAHLPGIVIWARKLDKPLVFTGRVRRFFIVYVGFVVFGELLCVSNECDKILILLPIVFTLLFTSILEKVLLNRYARAAKDKLASMSGLIIIAITGSYGKTSLKNFLAQILEGTFKVHASPRSVNTFAGIVADINKDLSPLCDVYIAEAGAREPGDIREIGALLEHHYGIIGKIGEAHLEYFKDIETIRKTKFELATSSPRLRKLFCYEGNLPYEGVGATAFPTKTRNIKATLEGTSFELFMRGEFYPFETEVLGAFNVINLSAAIMLAHTMGIALDKIQRQVARIKPIPHRLQKIEANGKLILDDSFNGNLEGMLEAIRLASLYHGRKVIVTPGLVESSEQANEEIAKAIDRTFDIAILTGELNLKMLSLLIKKPQKLIVKEKSALEEVLKAATREGDLILFANDAPSYI